MLDTLKLYTSDFEVKDGAAVTVHQGQLDYASGAINESQLFTKESGQPVFGAAASADGEDIRYHLQIQPKAGKVQAFVNFSVPKVINGENFYPVTAEESGQALERVNADLWNRGIHLDLNHAKLSRVDMFQNAYASEPFANYRPVFELLQCKRQQRKDYGTTFLWSNTQRELCVYNKLEEMEQRGARVAGLPPAVRFELRFKNAAVNKKMFGFSTASELVSQLDHVKEVYNDQLVKSLFGFTPGEVEVLVASRLECELRFYRSNCGKRFVSSYQRALGARELLSYGEDAIKAAFTSMDLDRNLTWRTIKRLRENWQTLAMIRAESSEVKTLSTLYSELKQLVLGV